MSERPENDCGQDRIRLTLPNDIAHVAVARDTVRAAARRYGYSASDLDHWDQVIEEAVTDVIQLAFDPGERASFDIDCLQGATGLTVRIRDRGRPFDPRRIEPAAPDRGLGWHMMQQLMDVVTLEYLGRDGQQLTLFKAAPARVELASGPMGSGPMGSSPSVAALNPATEPEGEVRCRKATVDDAPEITRLFYDCYHYSYFNEQIYRPEALPR